MQSGCAAEYGGAIRVSPVADRAVIGDAEAVVRVERHTHGPRVYVLGHRVHEWHLGTVVVAIVLAGLFADVWRLSVWSGVALGVGGWMVVKDWHDLFPRRRDTAAWRVGLHRRFVPLRVVRYGDGLPNLAALVALAVGIVNFLQR